MREAIDDAAAAASRCRRQRGCAGRCEACACTPARLVANRRRPRRAAGCRCRSPRRCSAAVVRGLRHRSQRRRRALAAQLAIDHVECFQFAAGPRRRSIRRPRRRAGRRTTGGCSRCPGSAPAEQLEFVDVRRCVSTQGASAHMMYRWRGQPLSVYVINSVAKSDVHLERLVVEHRRAGGHLVRRRPHLRGRRPGPARRPRPHRALPPRIRAVTIPEHIMNKRWILVAHRGRRRRPARRPVLRPRHLAGRERHDRGNEAEPPALDSAEAPSAPPPRPTSST